MDTGQTLVIEDDSSVDSSGTGGFPAPAVGRKATPITRPTRERTPVDRENAVNPDFSFREDEDPSFKDMGVEEDSDSLCFATKPEQVKKQPRRSYLKSKDSSLRARSTISESMRKSSLRKPASDRTGSLHTPRGHTLIGRKFLQPPKSKLLKPLPLIPPRGNLSMLEHSPRQRSRSYRLRRYRRMLEDALRAKAMGKGPLRPPTPKPLSAGEQNSADKTGDGKKGFLTSFPVSERRIPEYDALKDKHVKAATLHARRSLRSQIQQREALIPPVKRNTVRFQDEVTQIDQPACDFPDKKDLYLPKILPQPFDRPNSAPHSQEIFVQKATLRRDQHSVPRSRGESQPQERDWGKSVLDSYVLNRIYHFNHEEDPAVLSEQELLDTLATVGKRSWALAELREVIGRAQTTLTILHEELMLPKHVLQAPPISKEGLQAILLQCRSQLQLRSVIVSTLADIHRREDLLLSLLTLGEDAGSDFVVMYKEVMALSKSVLSRIVQIRTLTQDSEKFIYLDSDYSEKIHEDSSNLVSTFPHLLGSQRDYLNSTITTEDLKGRDRTSNGLL